MVNIKTFTNIWKKGGFNGFLAYGGDVGHPLGKYHPFVAGPELLTERTENAKHLQSHGWRGMEKKQSCKSIATMGAPAGMAVVRGKPLWGESQTCMV